MDEVHSSEELAELESLLYSQIHHSVNFEPPIDPKESSNLHESTANAPRTLRYRYFAGRPARQNLSINRQTNDNNAQAQPVNDPENSQSFSNFSSPLPQTIHLDLRSNHPFPQFFQQPSLPAVNNIVFMPPSFDTTRLTKSARRLMNKQLKKAKQQVIQAANANAELFKNLGKEDRKRVLKIEKRHRYLARKRERLKLLKEQKLIEKHNKEIAKENEIGATISSDIVSSENVEPQRIVKLVNKTGCEVIELSETDEDEVVHIEPNFDLVILSSEDEDVICKAEKDFKLKDTTASVLSVEVDDFAVEFVESPVAEPIDLDLEPTKTDAELMRPPSDLDTTSISSASIHSNENVRSLFLTPKSSALNERQELMNTPESTSNDFLDNIPDNPQQDRFNFSLHGNDLGIEKGFLKPRNLSEMYESESSCSASDISTPLKNPVFNELEFGHPSKELFEGNNLEMFSEFITPKRKTIIPSILTANLIADDIAVEEEFVQVPTKAAKGGNGKSDSDSSSESEYEEIQIETNTKSTRKQLPTLSHFEVVDTPVIQQPVKVVSKKTKATKTSTRNKFDFLRDAPDECSEQTPTDKAETLNMTEDKVGKKSKKRKQKINDNAEEIEQTTVDIPTSISDTSKSSTKKRKKQNKSKSDTEAELEAMPEAVIEELSPTKKSKKKQKSKSDSELEPQEISIDKTKSKKSASVDASVAASPINKRKKRKSKSDTEEHVSSPRPDASPNKNVRKKRKSENSFEDADEENIVTPTEEPQIVELISADGSDLEIIENEPECVDLSDFFTSEDEYSLSTPKGFVNLKSTTELNTAADDLDLNNSWEVRSETDSNLNRDRGDATVIRTDVEPQVVENEKSWCRKDFDADAILQTLPSDLRNWKILECDRVHIRVYGRGPRCNRCREIGHVANRCPNLRVLKCWLCGNMGHQEPRCPNTVCTRCGRTTPFFTHCCGQCTDLAYYVCKTCGNLGHNENLCPDFWRRYHITTAVGPVQQVPINLKPPNERWCSGCGKQGHFEHSCTYYNRLHIATKPHICKYTDVYDMSSNVTSHATSTQQASTSEPNVEHEEDFHSDGPSHDKKIKIKLNIVKQVYDLLNSPKGMDVLKELKQDLHFNCEITNEQYIEIEGHALDLLKVKKLFRELIKDPTANYRKVILARRELQKLYSAEGKLLLESLNARKIAYKLETALPIKAIYLYGGPLDVLLAHHQIERLFSKVAVEVKKSRPSDNTRSKVSVVAVDPSDSSIKPNKISGLISCVPLKISKFLLKELLEYPEHPCMTNLAEKYSVKWSVDDSLLYLEGNIRKIRLLRVAMGGIRNESLAPTHVILQRVKNVLRRSENPSTEKLDVLLSKCEYDKLNIVLFTVHFTNNGAEKLDALRKYEKLLETTLLIEKKIFWKIYHTIDFFTTPTDHKFYLDLIKDVNSTTHVIPPTANSNKDDKPNDHSNLNSSFSIFNVAMFRSHIHHLLATPEGQDFIKEIKTSVFNLDIKKEDAKLVFNCTEKQKENAMEKINFYFQIQEFEFPKLPSQIYRDLTSRLTSVYLNYYLVDCKQLHDEIFNTSGDKAALLSKLHGLLFGKYEFLSGRLYVDRIKNYLGILRNMDDRDPISVTDYRRLKTAAMYIFCPFPLNVNYELLVSLTKPPTLPNIEESNHSMAVDELKSKMRNARQTCHNDVGGLRVNTLSLFETHLIQSQYTRRSLATCLAFLSENFATIA